MPPRPDIARLPGAARLWTGMLLAPAAWLLAELGGYFAVARGCEPGRPGVPLPAPGNPALAQALLAMLLAVAAAIGLVVAVGNYRALPARRAADAPAIEARTRFMAVGGMLVSILFLLGLLFFALPPMLVGCAQAR